MPVRLCVALVILATGMHSERATAQDSNALARARADFQQAVELAQAGNCPAALTLFRQVGQVRMTPQVRFHIAACEAKLGRLVTALGGFELALAEADSVGPGFREEVERNVRELRARVPRLILERGQGAETAQIEIDGVVLGNGSIGVELPIDPGPHSVVARASEYQTFHETVTLAEGTKHTLVVALDPLTAAPSKEETGTDPPPAAARRSLPYIVGGAGVLSLLGSGALFVLRQGTLSDLKRDCPARVCSDEQRDAYQDLKIYHYGSLITLGVGAAAVGTGIAMLVLDRRFGAPRREQGIQLVPRLHPKEAGATVHLRF